MDAKEGLNDTYYDHAKDAQSRALDDEASAYEESLTNYIETLREKLDEAKLNMDLFMEQVTTVVTINAGTVLDKYVETGIAIDTALTEPWANAAEAMKDYEVNSLIALMDTWTKAGETGYFYNFQQNATSQLKSPWSAGTKAAKTFRNDVKDQMEKVVSNIKSNVSSAKTELSNLYKQIQDTEKKASSIKTSGGSGSYTGGGGIYTGGGSTSNSDIKALQEILNSIFGAGISADGIWGQKTEAALRKAQENMKKFLSYYTRGTTMSVTGKFDDQTRKGMLVYFDQMAVRAENNDHPEAYQQYINARKKLPAAFPDNFYAKGTLGTKKDEWAITDESWIGEEITLAAGKNGQLQYLKKGSAVMPADISANLVEWGKLNPNALSMPTMGGVNIMSNAIIQPNFEMNFDSLVHVDHCDQGTLKDLERMVDTKINQFGKQMNYAIKKIGGR